MLSKVETINFFEGAQGEALKELANTLWSAGHKVFLAGGCVRDGLLGRPYKDLDVVTDASVEAVMGLFPKTIPVGAQFGIVRVLIHGFEFEVARFRQDGPYKDGRHPDFVKFVGPQEDAARRDFTVNALFYDLKEGKILDFVQGLPDLQAGILRAVGDPRKRFKEDYLRLLRLLRFSVQLNFAIEPQTELAALELADHLLEVSGERLVLEICKTLEADPMKALEGFDRWRLASILFPHWSTGTSLKAASPGLAPGLSKNTPTNGKQFLLKGRPDPGWLLSMWLLKYQRSLCDSCLILKTTEEWSFHPDYLSRIGEMVQCFKLSRKDSQQMAMVASVVAWGQQWPNLREGFRRHWAQSEDFKDTIEAQRQLGVWPAQIQKEAEEWSLKPRMEPWLLGQDVLDWPPQGRGLVLKESLYLQYEGQLSSREAALLWLQTKK